MLNCNLSYTTKIYFVFYHLSLITDFILPQVLRNKSDFSKSMANHKHATKDFVKKLLVKEPRTRNLPIQYATIC